MSDVIPAAPGRDACAKCARMCTSDHTFRLGIRLTYKDLQLAMELLLAWIERRPPMKLARISGEGLAAIALSVAALWGCLVLEQVTVRTARQERARIIYDLRKLQRRIQEPVPASAPAPIRPRAARPTAG